MKFLALCDLARVGTGLESQVIHPQFCPEIRRKEYVKQEKSAQSTERCSEEVAAGKENKTGWDKQEQFWGDVRTQTIPYPIQVTLTSADGGLAPKCSSTPDSQCQ